MIEETLAKYVLAIFELGEGRAASCLLAISEKIRNSSFYSYFLEENSYTKLGFAILCGQT